MSMDTYCCKVSSGTQEALALFKQLVDAYWDRNKQAQAEIREKFGFDEDYRFPLIEFHVCHGEVVELEFILPSNFDYDWLDTLSDLLMAIDGIEYRASLFQSSSGGSAVWQYPEPEPVELDGKNICFIGEMDEELEDMVFLVEDYGTIQAALDDTTDVIIYGAGVDKGVLSKAEARGAQLVSEERFWEFIEEP